MAALALAARRRRLVSLGTLSRRLLDDGLHARWSGARNRCGRSVIGYLIQPPPHACCGNQDGTTLALIGEPRIAVAGPLGRIRLGPLTAVLQPLVELRQNLWWCFHETLIHGHMRLLKEAERDAATLVAIRQLVVVQKAARLERGDVDRRAWRHRVFCRHRGKWVGKPQMRRCLTLAEYGDWRAARRMRPADLLPERGDAVAMLPARGSRFGLRPFQR